ncbi:MAG: heavy metal-associated domain-containing protein [Verrucomicrobiota bacterium]|nr:heavy metal-associated domain-containing protein [Verrucomicrobiota bacterium]
MKIILYSLILFSVISCGKSPSEPEIPYPKKATVLSVEGMHCNACKAKIMRALSTIEGVEWAQIEVGLAEVAYMGPAERSAVAGAIHGVGYEVLE